VIVRSSPKLCVECRGLESFGVSAKLLVPCKRLPAMGPNPTLTTGRGRSKTELNQMSLKDFDVEITHLKFTFPSDNCSAPSISVLSVPGQGVRFRNWKWLQEIDILWHPYVKKGWLRRLWLTNTNVIEGLNGWLPEWLSGRASHLKAAWLKNWMASNEFSNDSISWAMSEFFWAFLTYVSQPNPLWLWALWACEPCKDLQISLDILMIFSFVSCWFLTPFRPSTPCSELPPLSVPGLTTTLFDLPHTADTAASECIWMVGFDFKKPGGLWGKDEIDEMTHHGPATLKRQPQSLHVKPPRRAFAWIPVVAEWLHLYVPWPWVPWTLTSRAQAIPIKTSNLTASQNPPCITSMSVG